MAAGKPARRARAVPDDPRREDDAAAEQARALVEQSLALVRPQPRPAAPAIAGLATNLLYYGDNLGILRERIPDASIDLVYLDPPFKSSREHNVIFKDESGRRSDAQIEAFDDTWRWGPDVELHYAYLTDTRRNAGTVPEDVAAIVAALRSGIGENPLMAYLVQMTIRLVELHRVLKPTGSLFIHCDPTASHYLKVILDAIFGVRNFVNEIVWKRSDAHNDYGQGARHLGRIHDVILFYRRSGAAAFNPLYTALPESTVKKWYRHVEPETGRHYNLADITGPGGASKGNPYYEFLGVTRYWRYSRQRMQELYDQGLIVQSKPGAVPAQKRYLDESKGVALQDMWTDIAMLRGMNKGARVGWATEKPVELLERIIAIASSPGDVVLDPFCGCGTAVVAASQMERPRRWIGIDITWLAIMVMRRRLAALGLDDVPVEGQPTELEGVRALLTDSPEGRYQFQWWALDQIGATPLFGKKKKGADRGVDGVITFTERLGELRTALVSVKSGHVNSAMVRDLKGTLSREGAAMGIFVTLERPSREMRREADVSGIYRSELYGRDFPAVQIITVAEVLDGGRPQLPPLVVDPHPPQRRRRRPAGEQTIFPWPPGATS